MKLNNRKLDKNVQDVIVTDKFVMSVLNAAEKRDDNEWTRAVLGRINTIPGWVGKRVLFHQNCRIGFRTKKQLPKAVEETTFKFKEGFLEVVSLIRSNAKEIYSVNDLIAIGEMNRFSNGNATYSFSQMKLNLIEHLGDEIVVSTHKNNQTLVTLRTTCNEILNDCYQASKTTSETHQIIRKASDIILRDIKNVPPNKSHYPTPGDITLTAAEQFLPESLFLFLSRIITGSKSSLKIASIGQAIIQTAHRENVMSPLQLALAVQMHYFTGSK